ncbi:mitochondrial uncoupling protein 4 [Grus japonensis]|uniref:Mitochondrial uncoupling protein 4 n=1 Tax=Grus japonensis TaxID=30415 RepID=A0ABC9WM17_GRUJA
MVTNKLFLSLGPSPGQIMGKIMRVTAPALPVSWQRVALVTDYISQEPVAPESLVSPHKDLAALQEALELLRFLVLALEKHDLQQFISKTTQNGAELGSAFAPDPRRVAVTFPLDLTKTRLQVQGEAAIHRNGAAAGQAVPYRGMLRTAAGIVREEGLRKLWQGATPAVYRHIGD